MKKIERTAALRAAITAVRREGGQVGLVPTMGFLHDGHVRLIRQAADECDFVVVSVFVNPLQFGPMEDYETYPRDIEGDMMKAAAAGADVVFCPDVQDMYPDGPPLTSVRVAGISEPLCGAGRPGHFDGVATVVTKLFGLCEPDRAYFGMKDAQQLALVSRLARDLSFRVQVVPCATVREPDGLALSSRNKYLSEQERKTAPAIYAALLEAAELVVNGERDPRIVSIELRQRFAREQCLDIEYAEVRDAGTIAALDHLSGDVLLAVAARVGRTRLIDNVVLHIDGEKVEMEAGEIQGEP